ncbi:Membrane protein insertase YidC [Chlamydiales bacterium STE3]|nr:Membrane protein insertase YidC [Chlamydiales bacterium STE3]
MDKRTLLFVITMSCALFLVNFYFQHQHEEELRVWNRQQIAKKETKLKQLNDEIQSQTASLKDLPVIKIFSDEEFSKFIAKGFLSDHNVLAIGELNDFPSEVYIKVSGKAEKYTLIKETFPQSLVVFTSDDKVALRVGELSDFGDYTLQLLSFDPEKVLLASYAEGQFSILQETATKLKEEIEEKSSQNPSLPPIQTLALLKVKNEWLPVGLYNTEEKRLLFLDEIKNLDVKSLSPLGKYIGSSAEKPEERFYVLENKFQQLVFSNYGGALKEINLPFGSENDKLSVVKEIEFDRDMVENHPQNAHFPSYGYFTPGKKAEGPFEAHGAGKLGGYYPLIRRDLIQDSRYKSVRVPPRYYAMNVVSEFPEVAELVYEVKSFEKNRIVFETQGSHRKITKIFTISEEDKGGPYTIDLSVKVEGDSRGLWITSGIPEVEWISGSPAPALKYRITRNGRADVETVDLPKEAITVTSATPDWLCNSNGFFGIILDALTEVGSGYRAQFVPGTVVPSRLVEIDQEYQLYDPAKMPGYMMLLPLKNNGGTMQFRIFAGPFSESVLKEVDKTYSNSETGYNPDYIACQTFHGWFSFISEPFAKFLFFLMKGFYKLTGSWAFSIILLTVALRLMLYPLNSWSMKSTIQMQKVAPEIKAIQEKYKKDPKKAQIEIVNLYREKSINPLSGCLPLLIQMPFLIGMFDLLKSTFELRGASFIPGWIDDLSAPDVLFSWKYPLFFIGNEFHLLPFLLGGVMFLQQRLMAPAINANEMTEQQRQQRAMGNVMTVVFTLMFYNFPSGLNIYWLSSMLLGILQQWWTSVQMKKNEIIVSPAKAEVKGGKR